MRSPCLILLAGLLATACGGNVVVDHGSVGAGASAGTGPGGAGGAGMGGAIATASVGASSTATGAGAALPTCTSLGYVGVGAACTPEGQECSMPGTCCGVPILCQNGQWTMTPLTCQQACAACGDTLGCSPAALCIEDQTHAIETSYRCAADPCPAGGAPDCTCADALCTDEFLMCIGPSKPTTLVCSDGTK